MENPDWIKLRDKSVEMERTGVTAENVHLAEGLLALIEPMTEQFDRKMLALFVYLSSQLREVLVRETIVYPVVFYDGEVANGVEMREKIIELARAERAAVRERGRNHFGQIGNWFWDTSKVENLGEVKNGLDMLIARAADKFKVDGEEFFRRVSLGK